MSDELIMKFVSRSGLYLYNSGPEQITHNLIEEAFHWWFPWVTWEAVCSLVGSEIFVDFIGSFYARDQSYSCDRSEGLIYFEVDNKGREFSRPSL